MRDNTKDKRRWRFRLRTMFVIVLLVGVVIAPLAERIHRHRRQRAAVEELSGTYYVIVDFDDDWRGWEWWRYVFGKDLMQRVAAVEFCDYKFLCEQHRGSATIEAQIKDEAERLRDLDPLAEMTELTSFGLGGWPISDLEPLAKHKKLSRLDLRGMHHIDMNSVPLIAPQLQTLMIDGPHAADLGPLAGLKELRSLDLGESAANDWTPLGELKHLQELIAVDSAVSDLSPLAGMEELEIVIVERTRVSDLSPLSKCPQLKILSVHETTVADVTPLANCKQLWKLCLSRTQVSDVGPLANLTTLRELKLENTPVSDISPLIKLKKLTIHLSKGADVTVPPTMLGQVRWH